MNTETPIRKLNDHGIEAFRTYLADLRRGAALPPPEHLLIAAETSRGIPGGLTIEKRPFATRLELARYLEDRLSAVPAAALADDIHLWTWLSLFFFDQVCPADASGVRRPGKDYRHILEPGYPNGHRHLLAGAYLVYTVYGLGETLSRLLLWTPLSIESRFHHQLAGRQTLITNHGVLDAVHRMFFNPAAGRPKPGALGGKNAPGTLLRFIDVIQQLDLTYDLYSMTGREILRLLPAEFDRWRKGVNA